MTTEEKVELITTYAKDKKLVEVYDENTDSWMIKVFDIWDFEGGKYRIKSKIESKFKAGDVLVCKTAENMLNPTRFLVKKVFDDEYELESSTITDRIECDPKRNVKVLQGFRGVVVWGDTYKTYGIEHPTEAFCPLWHLDGFKIIGNIYQDKELLNG